MSESTRFDAVDDQVHIQPDQDIDNERRESAVKPRSIRRLVVQVILAVAIVLSLIVLRAYLQPGQPEHGPITAPAGKFELPYPIEPSPAVVPSAAANTVAPAIPGDIPADRVDFTEVESAIDSLIAEQRTLSATVRGVVQQLDATSPQRIQPLVVGLTELADRLSAIETRLDALPVITTKVDELIAIQPKPQATVVKPGRSSSPPFRLVSVDSWGRDAVAVLGIGSETVIKAVGESIAGWEIESVDHGNQRAVVRRGEHRTTLSVGR